MLGTMDEVPKRTLWQTIRGLLGARIDALPARDMRGAINQLEPEAWQEVQYDERTAERQERDDA